MRQNKGSRLAGIQYAGIAGVSIQCKDAIVNLLQNREEITFVRILTHDSRHCFLLTIGEDELIAIKSGFASGYIGSGSHAFSFVLQLLDAHLDSYRNTNQGSELLVDEFEVSSEIMERLDNSALTWTDIRKIDKIRPIRPVQWHDYIFKQHWDEKTNGTLWHKICPIIPFGIIDGRIVDLAISFWSNPDEKLFVGWRRLEEIIKERTGLEEHSSRLFAQAFQSDTGKLTWKDLDKGELDGRAQLFPAAYKAHRNPRAHRELDEKISGQLREFLLLNHLFFLESEAQIRIVEEKKLNSQD